MPKGLFGHYHDWDNWKQDTPFDVTRRDGSIVGGTYIQHRKCKECGYQEVKTNTVFLI